jgi:hypothetical protein
MDQRHHRLRRLQQKSPIQQKSPSLPSPTSSPPSQNVLAWALNNITTVDEFLKGLSPYSMELASTNDSSPQAKALDWLQKDPLYNEYELHHLNQQYALAVFYLTTNGESWSNNSGWLSDDNECTWYMDDDGNVGTCREDSRLTLLDLFGNDLEGSIPAEMELLTGLERISLVERLSYTSRISGTNPTELLVWFHARPFVATIKWALAVGALLSGVVRVVIGKIIRESYMIADKPIADSLFQIHFA